MKKGYSIDSLLLEKFQKASDWAQDYFGYNNFAIAKFLRIVMVIAFMLREAISLFRGIDSSEITIIICSVMIIVKMESISRKAEQDLKNKSGLMNNAVSEYAVTRIIMQLVAIAAFGFFIKHLYYILNPSVIGIQKQYGEWKELFWDTFGMLMFFVAYFSSCTPKPYKPSKARKLIEDANNRVMQSMATSPSPKTALA